MGLDSFAYATSKKLKKPVDFVIPSPHDEPDAVQEIGYWRKDWPLHEWMGDLYTAKGGEDDMFNVAPVQITANDLDDLVEEVLKWLADTPDGDDWEVKRHHMTFTFIDEARKALEEGRSVYYFGWW